MDVAQEVFQHQYDNGLVLLAESMPWLDSAAFAILLPTGCIHDPEPRQGLSNFACEMVQRGCGDLDSRQFVEALERLGVDRSSAVSISHTSYGGATLSENLYSALSLHADLVRRPLLPESQIEEGRRVCCQELRAIEDDLAQKVMQSLRNRHYPAPWGRSSQGKLDAVEQMTIDEVRAHIDANYRPQNCIISVAGDVNWPRLKDHIEDLFGDWQSVPSQDIAEQPATQGTEHIPHNSSQTHIAVAYPSVPYRDDDYFQARAAVGVLSDGMSSRLFTEVREKRGLCYTVYASCHSLRDRGGVLCYSGTSTERAQETLDVLLAELRRLSDGIQQEELDVLKARLKSNLIMQQESSAARSAAIAGDWYHLGRIRRMDELSQTLDELSVDSINTYLAANPPRDFTVVTLGQKPLEVNLAV